MTLCWKDMFVLFQWLHISLAHIVINPSTSDINLWVADLAAVIIQFLSFGLNLSFFTLRCLDVPMAEVHPRFWDTNVWIDLRKEGKLFSFQIYLPFQSLHVS